MYMMENEIFDILMEVHLEECKGHTREMVIDKNFHYLFNCQFFGII